MARRVSQRSLLPVGIFRTEGVNSYRFDGKSISATSKTPKFSRIAEKAGVFEVVGIAHQQAPCQTAVSDIRMRIHELPSARVSHGKNIIEDIREGEPLPY